MKNIWRANANLSQALDLAPRLRRCDVDEVYAASGRPAQEVLLEAVQMTTTTQALMIEGRAEAMAGVCPWPEGEGIGVIWMLASEEATRHQLAFLKISRAYIAEIQSSYDLLTNFVDNRNARSQRWLEWLGFHIEAPEPFGYLGLPFRRFCLAKAKSCAARHGTVTAPEGVL